MPAITLGSARACSTVSGLSGQSTATGAYPAPSNSSIHGCQLPANSHNPWMNTAGVLPLPLAEFDLLLLARADQGGERY